MVIVEKNIFSVQEANDLSTKNTAIRLQLLAQHADQIFDGISLLVSSIDTRINDLSNRIANKEGARPKNNRNSINHSNQLLLPDSRPDRCLLRIRLLRKSFP